jgi:hypothetical protein
MIYLIVTLAVLARFIPHAANFSPVYGALLFGGAYLRKRDSIWFPVCLLGLSDVALNRWVYHMRIEWTEVIELGAFAAVALVGWSLRERCTGRRFVTAVLAGPTVFYLISNFGVWLGFGMYPATGKGLIACYVAGLPFYGNSLISGVLFSALLFGGYELYQRRTRARRLAQSLVATSH